MEFEEAHKKFMRWLDRWKYNRIRAYNRVRKYGLRGKECLVCKSTENLHFHHEKYQTDEGCTLCVKCHKSYHKWLKKEEENAKRKRGDNKTSN